jgi:hypothetical protein
MYAIYAIAYTGIYTVYTGIYIYIHTYLLGGLAGASILSIFSRASAPLVVYASGIHGIHVAFTDMYTAYTGTYTAYTGIHTAYTGIYIWVLGSPRGARILFISPRAFAPLVALGLFVYPLGYMVRM